MPVRTTQRRHRGEENSVHNGQPSHISHSHRDLVKRLRDPAAEEFGSDLSDREDFSDIEADLKAALSPVQTANRSRALRISRSHGTIRQNNEARGFGYDSGAYESDGSVTSRGSRGARQNIMDDDLESITSKHSHSHSLYSGLYDNHHQSDSETELCLNSSLTSRQPSRITDSRRVSRSKRRSARLSRLPTPAVDSEEGREKVQDPVFVVEKDVDVDDEEDRDEDVPLRRRTSTAHISGEMSWQEMQDSGLVPGVPAHGEHYARTSSRKSLSQRFSLRRKSIKSPSDSDAPQRRGTACSKAESSSGASVLSLQEMEDAGLIPGVSAHGEQFPLHGGECQEQHKPEVKHRSLKRLSMSAFSRLRRSSGASASLSQSSSSSASHMKYVEPTSTSLLDDAIRSVEAGCERIDLCDSCIVSAEELSVLCKVICQTPSVRQVCFEGIKLGDDHGKVAAVANLLASQSHVESLDISFNHISDEHLETLVESLGDNTSSGLKELRMCKNAIGNSGVLSLISALENNNTLKELDLSRNRGITTSGISKLADFAQYASLQAIHLDGCGGSGEDKRRVEAILRRRR